MSQASDQPEPIRGVEYYDSTVELAAAIVLRSAAGWSAISTGLVEGSTYWIEFERTSAERKGSVPRPRGDGPR